jgi:hypothetical protein
LSFFDEDDEPRKPPRPRRGRPPGGVATADSQTLLVRRAVAGGLAIVVIVLLLFVVRACRDSAKESALKSYNSDVTTLSRESTDLGTQFFGLLNEGNGQPQDLTSAISSFQVQADQQHRQAESLSVPDQMVGAQQNLLIALEMRRNALKYVAERISSALGDSGTVADKAINDIAGQMQVFLASDVLYVTRVVPFINAALTKEEIGGQRVTASRWLTNQTWLAPTTIAAKLDQQLTSGNATSGEPTGPGLHGTGILSTAYGDTTLQPTAPNRLTYQPGQEFVVRVQNQGENDEFEIKVTIRIKAGTQTTSLTTTIDKIVPQATAEARLPLDKTPPLGSAATISVQVAAVPGEKKTDNNKSEYQALFARG